MVGCLMAPRTYFRQCWLIVDRPSAIHLDTILLEKEKAQESNVCFTPEIYAYIESHPPSGQSSVEMPDNMTSRQRCKSRYVL